MSTQVKARAKTPWILSYFPILQWLPQYNWGKWLTPDIIAGFTTWGIAVPLAIAYASLAGMPPQTGIYTILASLLAYAIFGTGKQLVVSATQASAVMLASTVLLFKPADQAGYLVLAAAAVCIVGALFFLMGIFKLGFVANFISLPILEGFISGLAIYILIKQVPKLLGFHGEGETAVDQLIYLFNNLGKTNFVAMAVGLVSLALFFVVPRISARIPAGLLILALGIIVSTVFGLAAYGMPIVGMVPAGLPAFSLPQIKPDQLATMVPAALGIVLVIFSEALAMSKALASKHGYEINPDQEMVAFGVASMGSSVLGGLPAGGSLSQSAANDGAGAKTPLALIVAAAVSLVTVLWLTPLFTNLPNTILAALIIYAVFKMVKIHEMVNFFKIQKVEFLFGMVALVGVLFLDVLPGLMIAVILSLLVIIFWSSRPHVSVLGRMPGVHGGYRDITNHPEAKPIPGLLIFRLAGPVYYANASLFASSLKSLVAESDPAPGEIIIDMSANYRIDITTLETLEKLKEEFDAKKIELVVAEVHKSVQEIGLRSGLAKWADRGLSFATVDAAVEDFLARHPGRKD
jgi:high affinity sulfate transporter 1